MRFGWQGFQVDHGADWTPTVLTGNRKEGYVRIDAPSARSIQIRWQAARGPTDLSIRLDQYLSRLERDSRKAKSTFRASRSLEGDRLTYKYQSSVQGRGALFVSAPCGRVFFVEATSSGRNDSILTLYRDTLSSFRISEGDAETWAILGLEVCVPRGLDLSQKSLVAGKTALTLGRNGVRLEATRWGFAEQLLQRHSLEAWSRAVLRMPRADCSEEEDGLRLVAKSRVTPSREAIVKPWLDRNQIVTVLVQTRDREWTPRWDWLS